MFFKSYMRKYILKYIIFISVFIMLPFSFTCSAEYLGDDDILDEYVELNFVNIYLYHDGMTKPTEGIYIGLDDIEVSNWRGDPDDYVIEFSVVPSSVSDWKLGNYYSGVIIFRPNFYPLVQAYGEEILQQFKYDSFSARVTGQWFPTTTFPGDFDKFYKIVRHFPDKNLADVWHDLPGSAVQDGEIVSYSLPTLDWQSYTYLDYYEIYLYFAFENDASSSSTWRYRLYLYDFNYTVGLSEQELSIYPSFDSSVTDSFEQSESKALDSAHNLLDPAADEVLNPEIFNPDNQFMKGYIAAAKILNKFTEIPFINRLFKFSAVFGFVAVVLGIVYVAVGRSIRRG